MPVQILWTLSDVGRGGGREKWDSVIIIMSKFCFGFVVVMGDGVVGNQS